MPITPITMDTERAALLVIDAQNDLLHPDGLMSRVSGKGPDAPELEAFVSQCNSLAKAFRDAGRRVVFVRTEFRPDYLDAALGKGWSETFNAGTGGLVTGSWGAQPIAGLKVHEDDIVIVKQGQDAFHGTNLDRVLTNIGVDQCVIAGTDVLHSVSNTLRDGRMLGHDFFAVLVLPDHVATSLGANGRLERVLTYGDVMGYLGQTGRKSTSSKPAKPALIVVDIQNDFFGPSRHPVFQFQQVDNEKVIANNLRFAQTFRARGLPVIYARLKYRADAVDNVMTKFFTDVIRLDPPEDRTYGFLHDGTEGAAFAPGLGVQDGDIILDKKGHSAFGMTHLHRMLRNLGVGHCYVSGGATQACVSETVRDAVALGYGVTLVEDAVYPANSEHVDQVLAKYAEVRSTAQATEELEELFPLLTV